MYSAALSSATVSRRDEDPIATTVVVIVAVVVVLTKEYVPQPLKEAVATSSSRRRSTSASLSARLLWKSPKTEDTTASFKPPIKSRTHQGIRATASCTRCAVTHEGVMESCALHACKRLASTYEKPLHHNQQHRYWSTQPLHENHHQ